MKQIGSVFWLTLIAGLLGGFCIYFFLFGGLLGGFITLFIDFNTGLLGGAGMIGFGVFLIISIAIYLRISKSR
jgi:hypothetical protein